jgi:hypothetical protein
MNIQLTKNSKFIFQTFLILIAILNFQCASIVLPIAIKWERGKADLEKKNSSG